MCEPASWDALVRRAGALVGMDGFHLAQAELDRLGPGPWAQVSTLLDECWYVDLADSVRRERLAKCHQAHGRSSRQAWERTLGSDEQNARLVAACRARADLVVAPGRPIRGQPSWVTVAEARNRSR